MLGLSSGKNRREPAAVTAAAPWLARFPSIAGVAAALLGGVMLFNGHLDLPGGLRALQAHTGLSVVAAGLALAFRRRAALRLVLAGLVCANQLLLTDLLHELVRSPGGVVARTVLGVLLCGSSLALVALRGRAACRLQQTLALGAGVIGVTAVLGHAYGVSDHDASLTGTAFVLLSAGLLLARNDGLSVSLVAPGPGGTLVRRLLPIAVFLPLALGWLRVYGSNVGLFEPDLGTELHAIAMVPVFAALIWWASRAINRSDAARRESEGLLRWQADLMDHAHEPLIVCEAGRVIRAWNRGAESLYGWSAGEAIGQCRDELLQTQGPSADEIEEHLERYGRWQGELTHKTREGRTVLVETRMSSTSASDGRLLVLISERDVTERRRDEQQLVLLKTALEAAANGAVITDRNGTLLWVNPAFTALTGYAREEIVGKHSRLLKSGQQPPEFYQAMWTTILRGEPWRGSLVNRRKDGTIYDEEMTITPVRAADGQITHFVAIKEDVTERKKAEAALSEADKRKTEFLAMLSHELRNPLAPIRNSLFILDRVPPGTQQSRRAHAIIERQVTHMTRLVDELLDVTRIARGKIQLQRRVFDLVEVARHAVEDHRSTFETHGLTLNETTPADPVLVDGDSTRIAQVIGNLLQNASKFTPTGGAVELSLAADRERGEAVLRVTDTGAGIERDMLPHLFEPFTQADTTLDRSKGGLGLGLALTKGLVEMHGGSVAAASDGPGKGSEFAVRLPLVSATVPAAGTADHKPADAVSLRVLVIEDNVDSAESLRDALELGGHHVRIAFNGPDGLAKAREVRPDVVVCDIGLPEMDGYAVARAMRADDALRGVRLIALSGYASPEDLEQSRAAGFEDHIAKPPSLPDLERKLARYAA